MAEYNSGANGILYSNEQARRRYGLAEQGTSLLAGELDDQLADSRIAQIRMPLGSADFLELIELYEDCIEEHPDLLAATNHKVDTRTGNDAGHKRKELEVEPTTGKQLQDAKSLMHFNEHAEARWREEFASAPADFRHFLEVGYELHHGLIAVAKAQFAELEATHKNINKAYFPLLGKQVCSLSFMRVLSYDSYPAGAVVGDVAKPHFDIGGATIQAYADAPGFWGAANYQSKRVYHESDVGYAQFFMGIGHSKLYGDRTQLKPLYHGVERIVPEGITIVPKRHAVVLFIDAPFVNYGVTPADTLPELHE